MSKATKRETTLGGVLNETTQEHEKQKGWARQAFEHTVRLSPDDTVTNAHGEYTKQHTQDLWRAFKAGLGFTAQKGLFVVAEIHDGHPYFPANVFKHDFKDEARDAQKRLALKTGAICAVFQQVSAYNPANNQD